MPEKTMGVSKHDKTLLSRPTGVIHSFSDVFTGKEDFDAELTHNYRHLRPKDSEYNIETAKEAAYGVDLVAQLVDDVRNQIETAVIHPDIEEIRQFVKKKAVRVIANIAPRVHGTQGNNGTNFYLAILDNGVEIYATPLQVLEYVRNRIISLYEIPNKNHPFFHGGREQFRSSVIARTCQCPEHLVRSFKEVPQQDKDLIIAFTDKFGNLRCRAEDVEKLVKEIEKQAVCRTVGVQIGSGPMLKVFIVDSLDSVPIGQLGIYRNVADGDTNRSGYFELVAKWKNLREQLSAYDIAGRPQVGTEIKIFTDDNN